MKNENGDLAPMIPPKTILAASDLSKKSIIALKRAALLARHHGADLTLLHVVTSLPPKDIPAPYQALADTSTSQQQVEAALDDLKRQAGQAIEEEIAYHCQIETGKDFVAIIRKAKQIQADLIVIAAHGGHSMRDLFLGTTAEKIIRKGGFPVLTVKNLTMAPYRKVLIPTDFSEAAQKALVTVLALAPEAHIDLMHVYSLWGENRLSLADNDENSRENYHQQSRAWVSSQMTEWLQGVNLGTRKIAQHFRFGRPAPLITQIAKELETDLVALGTSGRNGLPYVLLGSVAEYTLREAPCDVLTVRPSEFRFEFP